MKTIFLRTVGKLAIVAFILMCALSTGGQQGEGGFALDGASWRSLAPLERDGYAFGFVQGYMFGMINGVTPYVDGEKRLLTSLQRWGRVPALRTQPWVRL